MSRILQPEGWPAPRGYSNGIEARGRLLFVAGQVAFDATGTIVDRDLVAQIERALANVVAVLASGDATPAHLVRLTWYVTDMEEYRREQKRIGAVYRRIIGNIYPAMTLVAVSELVERGAKVEIEATAVVPEA